jgi:DNA gyrase subunit A
LVDTFLVVDDSKLLLIAGKNGLGIRTRFSAFLPNGGKNESEDNDEVSPRKRGGQGVTAMNTKCIVGALSVDPESEILMITANGQAMRCPVNNIRETNRGSKGVKLVNLGDSDKLIAISEVIELNEDESDQENSDDTTDKAVGIDTQEVVEDNEDKLSNPE